MGASLRFTLPVFISLLGCTHALQNNLIEPETIDPGQSGGTLTVRISGVDPESGTVRAGLFEGEEGFPTEEGLLVGRRVAASLAVDETVDVVFEAMPQGRYALSIFHDLNDNEELDTGSFGIPTEPYGFSRGVQGNFGPPEFEEAAFNHGLPDQLIPVHLGGIRLAPR